MKLKTKKEIGRYSHPQRTQNISKERKFLHCLRNQKLQAMELYNWIIKLYVPSQLLNLTLHWKKEARAV